MTYRLRDCDQKICARFHNCRALFYYIFENFAPHVELLLVVSFNVSAARAATVKMDNDNCDFDTDPLRFQNHEVTHVSFERLVFCVHFAEATEGDE